MTRPLFSIVIPTYNRSDLIQDAVRSVLRQTCTDFEVVVSDNGSEDDTPEVIRRFEDRRVRYVRTPSHMSIAGSWEFARAQAQGRLVMTLSDDDALVPEALERFEAEHRRHDANFMFCSLAEYRDRSFIGADRNTLNCPPFSGVARVVTKDEFLAPLFQFRPAFNMHPSAFVVGSDIIDRVVQRCGRFFCTNGVEYFAWPPAAVFARRIVFLDAPLVILGRTYKSWGSTIVLANPGKEQIQKMIADVEHRRDWVPLTNFTLCNLVAEGLLLSQRTFAEELAPYPFDEQQYLKKTILELRRREAMGVDVRAELDEAIRYADKYPHLVSSLAERKQRTLPSFLRRIAKAARVPQIRRYLDTVRQGQKIRNGRAQEGFWAAGDRYGFDGAMSCADFVARVTASRPAVHAGKPAWNTATGSVGQRAASS